jgi:hypothetical protein
MQGESEGSGHPGGEPMGLSVACDAILIKCMDWRIEADGTFRPSIERSAEVARFDTISIAGGARSVLDGATRALIFWQIELACRLHGIRKVILTNHTSCGTYGTLGTIEKLISDLGSARRILLGGLSRLEVLTFLIRLEEAAGRWGVDLERIDRGVHAVAGGRSRP